MSKFIFENIEPSFFNKIKMKKKSYVCLRCHKNFKHDKYHYKSHIKNKCFISQIQSNFPNSFDSPIHPRKNIQDE